MLENQKTENNPVFSDIDNFTNRGTSLPTASALVPINLIRLLSY